MNYIAGDAIFDNSLTGFGVGILKASQTGRTSIQPRLEIYFEYYRHITNFITAMYKVQHNYTFGSTNDYGGVGAHYSLGLSIGFAIGGY